MRRFQVLICAAVLTALLASASHAVVRRTPPPLLWQRTAVSGYLGKGLPVGEFSDEREGYGNQKEGAIDWAVEIEHFLGHTASLGFSYANTEYEDKDLGDALKTKVETASGFIRVVVPTATAIRPYLRFGMGGVQVEFLDPVSREDSEWEFSLQAGGGLLWLPARWLGLSAQALYYHGSTSDSIVYATPDQTVVVGFDVSYWAFSGGVSLFFP
jgi:opacity protein-like surface antigen